jgi:mono/diheme cytochrome c family protein
LLVALFAAFVVRGSGISARRTPWPGEARLATAFWRFMVPTAISRAPNPVPDTPEIRAAALEHFADHCATCHANDGSGDTPIGRNLFPRAPDMRQLGTQELTDGEIFYAIEHGIPWTGMPAWGNGTAEGQRQSWELVRFIRRLPLLTPDELSRMEQFNPRSPAAEARDREIDEFLKGTDPPKGPGQ